MGEITRGVNMKRIGIVILTHNNGELTNECLKSFLMNRQDELEYYLYLVDNSPISQLTKFKSLLKANDGIIYRYFHVNNQGYSAGNNIGAIAANDDNCDFIIISNNDVIFNSDSINNMIEGFNFSDNIGIVGPMVFLPNGKVQEINMLVKTTLAGTYKYILRNTPLSYFSKKYINSFQYDLLTGKPEKPFLVHSVSGCCFMMSKECANRILPLDENVFLYHEEIILGVSMEKCGFETLYYPSSTVVHLGGMSTGSKNSKIYQYFIESEMYYFRKILGKSFIECLPLLILRGAKFWKMEDNNLGRIKKLKYLVKELSK